VDGDDGTQTVGNRRPTVQSQFPHYETVDGDDGTQTVGNRRPTAQSRPRPGVIVYNSTDIGYEQVEQGGAGGRRPTAQRNDAGVAGLYSVANRNRASSSAATVGGHANNSAVAAWSREPADYSEPIPQTGYEHLAHEDEAEVGACAGARTGRGGGGEDVARGMPQRLPAWDAAGCPRC